MGDAMRVFLAVALGDAMSAAAHAWGRAVATTLGPAASALTWVPPSRVHITLRFFGELPPDRVDALGQALIDGPWSPAFEIGFGTPGTYPPSGRPRVLWLGMSTGRDALVRLHDAVAERLARAGGGIAGTGNAGAGAGDAFSPHVTIARVRRGPPPGLGRALRDACARTPQPAARADVHELTLFESVLKSKGPAYRPIVRVPLAGGIDSG
jgi:RNA 2',3'-cyclic 3'-phosphodiesterase